MYNKTYCGRKQDMCGLGGSVQLVADRSRRGHDCMIAIFRDSNTLKLKCVVAKLPAKHEIIRAGVAAAPSSPRVKQVLPTDGRTDGRAHGDHRRINHSMGGLDHWKPLQLYTLRHLAILRLTANFANRDRKRANTRTHSNHLSPRPSSTID